MFSGGFGLETVETRLWGGLFLTLVIAGVGIVLSLEGSIPEEVSRWIKEPGSKPRSNTMAVCLAAALELAADSSPPSLLSLSGGNSDAKPWRWRWFAPAFAWRWSLLVSRNVMVRGWNFLERLKSRAVESSSASTATGYGSWHTHEMNEFIADAFA